MRNKSSVILLVLVLAGFAGSYLFSMLHSSGVVERDAKKSPELERHAQKIVCGAPGVTEMLFALGCGERVAAVTDFCDYPQAANQKPKIGGWLNPNREKILSLKPDLVATQGKHEKLAVLCRENGIKFFSVKMDTLSDIFAAITSFGNELGKVDAAAALRADMEKKIKDIRAKITGQKPLKVFLTFGRMPGDLSGLATVGPGTFMNDLIVVAGGDNIFSDVKSKYPQISKESLIRRDPQVIIEAYPEGLSGERRERLRQDWKSLPMLDAVKSGRIYYLTEDYLLKPGTRVVLTARRLGQIIHPEVFGDE